MWSAPPAVRSRRGRRRPAAALRPWLCAILVSACGGGGGGGGGDNAAPGTPPTLPTARVSADSPVAAGCTGGGADTGGTLYVNAEVEPTLARAPADARQLLAAWQQDRWSDGGSRALVSAVSSDGGASWRRTLHPLSRCGGAATGSAGDFERASDPWVDIGSDGTLHLMGLSINGSPFATGSRSAMLATRSTDGGLSWSPPQRLVDDGPALFNDKNTLTVDPLDPRRVYAVWDRLDTAGNGPTLLARSFDAGASWQPAREIYRPLAPAGGTAQTIGNRIVVLRGGGQRGLLVNVFTQIDVSGGNARNTVRVQRSADQGQTWGAAVTVADHRGVGARDPGTGTAIRDGGIVPAVAAGPDGTLWVAWQDSRFSGGLRDAIAVSRSLDGGSTWSAPAMASRSGASAAFTPTLSVRDDGRVGLLYFDLRPDTTDTPALLAASWLASSSDGLAWDEAAVWNPFDMARAPNARGLFLGDYMGLVPDGARFVPLLTLSSTDLANRTDVYLLPVLPAGLALVQAAAGGPGDDPAFEARRRAFTQRAMERRVPDWGRRVGLNPP